MGGLWGHDRLPERFARTIARRHRLIVGHCDCAGDAERVQLPPVTNGVFASAGPAPSGFTLKPGPKQSIA